MSDLPIINILTHKDLYDKYRSFVCTDALSDIGFDIVKAFDEYYKKYDNFTKDTFTTYFNHVMHPDCKTDKRQLYNESLGAIETELSSDIIPIIEQYKRQYLNDKLMDLAVNNADISVLQGELDDYKKSMSPLMEHNYINPSIKTVLEVYEDKQGMNWRLDCINKGIGKLTPGMFGVIAGRPDSAKSSFLCSELTHLASQIPDDKCILLLNNENRGSRLLTRLYRSMLNTNIDSILKYPEAAEKKYFDMGGDKIKILDIHGCSTNDIEAIIERYDPALLAIDMLDHVRMPKTKKSEREDQTLERLYQWCLEVSCTICPVIGTSQLNKEAEGVDYPSMDTLKGSSTGKQGAATFILMLGRTYDEGFENSRFLSTPKNKTDYAGIKKEVYFNRYTARFTE